MIESPQDSIPPTSRKWFAESPHIGQSINKSAHCLSSFVHTYVETEAAASSRNGGSDEELTMQLTGKTHSPYWHNRCQTKNMTHRNYILFLLTCLALIANTPGVGARTSTFDVARGNQTYSVSVSYDVEKAYAGTHNLEVTISIQSRDAKNLELVSVEAADQPKIRFRESSRDSADTGGLRTTEYKYVADIPADTEPRVYAVTLTLAYPGDKNATRTFDLFVGVRNKGKLNAVADDTNTVEFYTGTTNTYRLELENNFPDFPVNVRSVSIKSDPVGLIESKTIPVEGLSIDPLQRGAIDLTFKAAPMSLSSLLGGFSDSSRMILHVTYDDSFGHVITDLTCPVKIKVRPRDRFLAIAMLIGVAIGAILKLSLQQLQRQGIISTREVVVAAGITSLIGVVVSFVAVVGRIKIIAFDQMGSYDNPAAIFIISLAGTFCGAQLLSTLFKFGGGTATDSAPAPDNHAGYARVLKEG